jgi:hypothetical protein
MDLFGEHVQDTWGQAECLPPGGAADALAALREAATRAALHAERNPTDGRAQARARQAQADFVRARDGLALRSMSAEELALRADGQGETIAGERAELPADNEELFGGR